ncbi:ECF transporter S component [Pediococcus claussenii]|nr:ECF transporter S component [Pediococcus claussenii]ANZ69149.1 hypothetical protein AYR57_02000 [Pediococcus claussenii]ANZ70966.1 hypothetical protein AYR58_02000 [Pediococcus claussenii]
MNTKRLTLLALLIALCVVGANIKVMGSVAFDSMPAFFGTLVLGPVLGGVLGLLGHLVSAGLSGFPLTLPVHLVIAGIMFLTMLAYGYLRKGVKGNTFIRVLISDVVAYAINVPLSLVFLYPILKQAVFAYFFPLTIASIANIVVAEIVFAVIRQARPKMIANFQK